MTKPFSPAQQAECATCYLLHESLNADVAQIADLLMRAGRRVIGPVTSISTALLRLQCLLGELSTLNRKVAGPSGNAEYVAASGVAACCSRLTSGFTSGAQINIATQRTISEAVIELGTAWIS